jgi:uncharacterized repeat protein (TIGR01451 family)
MLEKTTMYKLLIASLSVIGIAIASPLVQQLPLNAQLQPGAANNPAAKKQVDLNLSVKKKMMKGEKISFQPLGGSAKVQPGDTLHYSLVAKIANRGVKNLVLKQPVPKGTVYIKNSATQVKGSELTFSIDGGKNYTAKPMIPNPKKGAPPIEAPETSYTHIRWRFPSLLPANSNVVANYEVKVK